MFPILLLYWKLIVSRYKFITTNCSTDSINYFTYNIRHSNTYETTYECELLLLLLLLEIFFQYDKFKVFYEANSNQSLFYCVTAVVDR